MRKIFIGVDVGTGSARAGAFTADGHMLGSGKADIRLWRESGDIVEQSSDDIWSACARAIRAALAQAGVGADAVGGLSFDATCSLVLLDARMQPLAAGPSGDPQRNVIVWMDHRAAEQARAINATGDEVLSFVGGSISPEMQTPKLLWLAQHLPQSYRAAGQFLDLTDYLTWRATGSLARSVCTVTCKWTYLAHQRRWSEAYFRRIGLGDIADDGFARIGTQIVDPGAPLAAGLDAAAACELGLNAGTPVGAGMIDAHAGGVGSIGGRGEDGIARSPESRVAFITGTSACAMAVNRAQHFVPGVWGPYYSAMIPGLWLTEGGQSAAGAAIDFLLRLHPAHHDAAAEAERTGHIGAGATRRRSGGKGRWRIQCGMARIRGCTSFRTSWATAPRSPIPRPARCWPGWRSTTAARAWCGCTSPVFAASPMGRRRYSTPWPGRISRPIRS